MSNIVTMDRHWGSIPSAAEKHDEAEESTSQHYDQDVNKKGNDQMSDTVTMDNHTAAKKYDMAGGAIARTPEEIMIKRIANSNARIKNQQRGEPDLTEDEKISIVTGILKDKPNIFLERFGNFMAQEDLSLFENLKSDYEIQFHLKEIKKHLDSKKNKTKVRNRRYEAMKKLVNDGSYFSEDSMRERDPLMYEHYVGQYLTKEETEAQQKKIDAADLKFSTILMDFMDRKAIEEHLNYQKQEEDDMMEEEEEDTDSEGDQQEMEDTTQEKNDGKNDGNDSEELSEEDEAEVVLSISSSKPTPASAEEKAMLRHEFMRNMQLRFLEGKDRDFNYSSIDDNVEYDSLDIRQHDEEEKYFDDEQPTTVGVDASSDEGSSQMNQVPYVHGKDSDVDYDEMDFDDCDVIDHTDR
ncbi:coiled-coil domain-containing protein 97-like [Glandiceps talaboti]